MNVLNPSELRIGNIVTIDNPRFHPTLKGAPLVITGINKRVYNGEATYDVQLEHINQEPNTYYDTYSQFMKFVKPIPLTEEILLKCAFQALPYFTVTNSHMISLGRERWLSIGDTENANQMVWLQHIERRNVTDLVCVHNYDYDGRMALHQLQNLYYSLTGEELLKDITKNKES